MKDYLTICVYTYIQASVSKFLKFVFLYLRCTYAFLSFRLIILVILKNPCCATYVQTCDLIVRHVYMYLLTRLFNNLISILYYGDFEITQYIDMYVITCIFSTYICMKFGVWLKRLIYFFQFYEAISSASDDICVIFSF